MNSNPLPYNFINTTDITDPELDTQKNYIIPVLDSIAIRKDITPSDKLLLGVVYALSHNDIGYCYASNKYMAERIGLEPNTVHNIIGKLKKLGLILEYEDPTKYNQKRMLCISSEVTGKLNYTSKTTQIAEKSIKRTDKNPDNSTDPEKGHSAKDRPVERSLTQIPTRTRAEHDPAKGRTRPVYGWQFGEKNARLAFKIAVNVAVGRGAIIKYSNNSNNKDKLIEDGDKHLAGQLLYSFDIDRETLNTSKQDDILVLVNHLKYLPVEYVENKDTVEAILNFITWRRTECPRTTNRFFTERMAKVQAKRLVLENYSPARVVEAVDYSIEMGYSLIALNFSEKKRKNSKGEYVYMYPNQVNGTSHKYTNGYQNVHQSKPVDNFNPTKFFSDYFKEDINNLNLTARTSCFLNDVYKPALELLKTIFSKPGDEALLAEYTLSMYESIVSIQESALKKSKMAEKYIISPRVILKRYIDWLGDQHWIVDKSYKLFSVDNGVFFKFLKETTEYNNNYSPVSGEYLRANVS